MRLVAVCRWLRRRPPRVLREGNYTFKGEQDFASHQALSFIAQQHRLPRALSPAGGGAGAAMQADLDHQDPSEMQCGGSRAEQTAAWSPVPGVQRLDCNETDRCSLNAHPTGCEQLRRCR